MTTNKTHSVLHRLLREWLIVLLVLMAAVCWLASTRWATLGNAYLYDRLLSSHSRTADSQIVLINIDDNSLAKLGQWPWSRDVHAEMFKQLALQQPRAALFDVILTEPSSNPAIDRVLADAMTHVPLTIPVLMQDNHQGGLSTVLPFGAFAHSAKLGHIAILPDADGVVRNVSLMRTDDTNRTWPLTTTQLLGADFSPTRQPELLRIPFNIPQSSFISFSYDDLLNGRVPQGFLKDKFVLIGATATGLGDQYPTPSSGHFSNMPGIEIHANILDALLNHLSVKTIDSTAGLLLASVLPTVILLTLLLWLRERYHLLGFALFTSAYIALVCSALWFAYFWIPPAAALFGIVSSYVLWSWRRQAVMLQHVQHELKDMRTQTGHLFQVLPQSNDSLARSFVPHALELNIERVRLLGHFVTHSLQQLPFAVLLIDGAGKVLMHNRIAQQILGQPIDNTLISDVFKRFDAQSSTWFADIQNNWNKLEGLELHGEHGQVFELHALRVQLSPEDSQTLPMQDAFWQVSLIDLSNERAVQRQRNELITFMSHDLRTPQVGILALIQMYHNERNTLSDLELTTQISEKVHTTLDAASGLVLLARAQNTDNYRMEEVNFTNIIYSAVEQVWAQANAKQITIHVDSSLDEQFENLWLHADGVMLSRALMNVLNNAIRYSPAQSSIQIQVRTTADDLICEIRDEGVGMNEQTVQQLNLNVHRTNQPNTQQPDAAGSLSVGLHMVAAVVAQHKGQLQFTSEPQKGTTVSICLPRLPAIEE